MLTKSEWIEEQKLKEKRAKENGFTDEEIKLAYKINRECRKVSYIDKYALLDAREQLKKLDGILDKLNEGSKHFNIDVRPDCQHAWYRYAYFNDCEIPDDMLMKKHYITPIYNAPLFQQLGYSKNQCPVAEWVDENINLAWYKQL